VDGKRLRGSGLPFFSGSNGGSSLNHAPKCFRSMKVEDAPSARVRVKSVREERLRGVGLVEEGERPQCCGQVFGEPGRVLLGLNLDAGEGDAARLCLNDSDGTAINVQQIVCVAVTALQRKLAHRDTATGTYVDLLEVLDVPRSSLQGCVDALAR